MKRILLLVAVVAIGLAGCGGGLKSKIVGKWKFDLASLKAPGLTDAIKNGPDFAKQMGTAGLELKADGTYVGSDPGGTSDTGKCTLDGNKLTTTPDKGADKTKPSLVVNEDGSKIHGIIDTGAGNMEFDMVKA